MDLRRTLQRYGDPLLGGGLALVIVLELLAWDGGRPAASLGAGLLATVPLAIRRRSPLGSFVLVMAGIQLLQEVQPGFDNDSFAFVATFFVALYSLGRHAAGGEAWLGAAALPVVMLLFVQGDGGLGRADLGDAAFVIVFAGAPWAAGLAVRLRHEREALLRAENVRLQEESARAVAEERSRIARELHDVVSHAISVTVLQARGARRTLDADPEQARRALDAIERTNTAALGDMRRLLAVLRDTEPADAVTDDHAPQPSLAHLDRLLDHVRESGVAVELEVVGAARDLPPGVDLSAYRIVQEALTNVLKHTEDARATVRLQYADDALTVAVSDDARHAPGAGADDGRPGGHGLIGIRERVSVIGGEIDAGPGPDGGFAVRARLPYALELS